MKKSVTIKPIDTAYQSVKQILEEAREKAYSAVNFAMVQAYWNIGRIIVEEEQRGKAKAGYGEYLLRELSERLTKDFGRGFDPSNLRYMRLFYHSFENMNAPRLQSADQEICDAVRHISLDGKKPRGALRIASHQTGAFLDTLSPSPEGRAA
jgi:hypothetical protein